jgi:hypothetical protein
MTPYYKYDFVSPDPIYSTVKEELNSYFDSGAVDDLLFPKWTDDCLKTLGRSSYPLKPGLLTLDDFVSTLPEDFHAVREAWLCLSATSELAAPSSVYFVEQETTVKMDQLDPNHCSIQTCSDVPEQINVVMKKSQTLIASYTKQYLLRPGNISVQQNCALDCRNYGSVSADTFDIRDGKFVTNFRTGHVYLVYYSTEFDCSGVQVVPDNFRIRDYIEKYIVYKTWKKMADNTTDEGLRNFLDAKQKEAKAHSDEAKIIALTEVKKETVHQKAARLARQNQRLNRFNIN